MEEMLPHLLTDLATLNADNKRVTDELIARAEAIPTKIDDEAAHDAAAEVVKDITKHVKAVGAAREADKATSLEAGRQIDGFYGKLSKPIDDAKRALGLRLGDYLNRKAAEERKLREAEEARKRAEAEEARKRAEELERQAATDRDLRVAIEADKMAERADAQAAKATKAAEAKPADLARSRTSMGTVSTLKREWVTEIIDVDKIDLNALRGYFRREEIEKAVRGAFNADHNREIEGAKHYEQNVASVR
jgi:hypothetical protein